MPMRIACTLLAVTFLAGCPTSAPPTDGAPTTASGAVATAPAAAASATPVTEPTTPPTTTASATATSSSAAAGDEDENAAPWVRGLSSGCTADDDCIKVRACTSYAIRRDAKATFEERIKGVRFRCERTAVDPTKAESRPACVDGTCELVTP